MSRTTLLSEVITEPALVVGMPCEAGQQHPVYSVQTMLPFESLKVANITVLQLVMPPVDAYPNCRLQNSSCEIKC